MKEVDFQKVSEHQEQSDFFNYLDLFKLREHPELHPLYFAVPNGVHLAGGAKQRAAMMNKLKREGFMPGAADTVFLSGRGGYLGMVMEFKTPERKTEKDGGLSENQMEFLRAAKSEGYLAKVAYGADEGIAIANQYLSWPSTQELIGGALAALEKDDVETAKALLQEVVLKW
jgi:hypothetical protein